ncbi:MAG: glycosyltransferase family 4 protein [Acidobacteriota bacterium]|nr:glycosyltransferase family 4 protein [Acidobacteriota bacterium]
MSERKNSPRKPRLLILCRYYLPATQAGGGVQTLVQMIERFRDRFDFLLICVGSDVDKIPYATVESEVWTEIEGTPIYYLRKGSDIIGLRRLIRSAQPDAVYLNSVFSAVSVNYLLLRKLRLIPSISTVIAPNGELAEGALKNKSFKKKPFAAAAKLFGLYENLIWKTTAAEEQSEARKFKGAGGKIFLASNLSPRSLLENYAPETKPKKKVGAVRMAFLARYLPIKNFKWLIENLFDFTGDLTIDLYGPIEDAHYWRESEKAIENLPPNVKINYKGFLKPEKVLETLSGYHFFILPTLGENFGYVFVEAMAAGCPLIISDRTPWRDLKEKGVGWDLSLADAEKWRKVLTFCVNMDELSYREISSSSRKYAERLVNDPQIEEDTLTVLHYSLKKD